MILHTTCNSTSRFALCDASIYKLQYHKVCIDVEFVAPLEIDSLLIARAHCQMFHHQFRNRHRGNQGKTKKNQEKENLNDQYHNISKIQHQKLN